MPPKNIYTQNTDNSLPSSEKEKEVVLSVTDVNMPLKREVESELAQMERNNVSQFQKKKEGVNSALESLDNKMSRNQFDIFAKQRDTKQALQKPSENNQPSRVSELMKSRYSDYPIKPLRTYRGDVEEAIQRKNASFTSIAIAEKKRREARGEKFPIKKKGSAQNILIVILILTLVAAGAGSLFIFLYAKYEQSMAVIALYKQTIIPSDTGIQTTFTPRATTQNLLAIKKDISTVEAKAGSVVYVNLVEKSGKEKQATTVPTPLDEVLAAAAPSIPSHLLRSLESEYMFGLYVLEKNEPFLILKTNSYETAFSGMLAWEETLLSDAAPIFFSGEQVFASTSKKTAFEDSIVKNKDTRVAKNVNGETVLLYSFFDKKTLIITTKEDVFSEILGRYLNSKLVR